MPNTQHSNSTLNSVLSFRPLINVLKKMIEDGKPGARKLYQSLLSEIESVPELLQPVKDPSILERNKELIETLLSTIFPPSSSKNRGMYAVTFPFQLQTIYASTDFRNIFLKEGSSISVPDRRATIDITNAAVSLAHNVILQRLYSLFVPVTTTSVHSFTDPEAGLKKHYELRLNAQFVDVKPINDFSLPQNVSAETYLTSGEKSEVLPLENFQFEGIVVIDVTDVTQEQVVSEIKNLLININAFSDTDVYDELQQHVQSLVGLKDVKIGITPFFKKSDFYLYTDTHYRNSILFKNKDVIRQKDKISQLCQQLFYNISEPVLYKSLSEKNLATNELLQYYVAEGAASLILCPLKCEDGELIGLLEIVSTKNNELLKPHVALINPVIPLFTLALEKTNESLDMQIDKTIKDHFTAIQPAVEWKFTEAAFHFLQNRQMSELPKMPTISFADVYPLYGSIDIRN